MSEDDEQAEDQPAAQSAAGDSGYGLGRLLALSDGVFAIAMTLLVLSIPVPELGDHPQQWRVAAALLDLVPNFVAFGVSFAIVGNYWTVHHRIFQRGQRVDRRLLQLNLIVLLFVCLVPFSTNFLIHYGSTVPAIEAYYGNLVLLGLAFAVLSIHGHRRGLVPYATRRDAVAANVRGIAPTVAFAGAMLIGLFSPRLGAYGWVLVFPAGIVVRWLVLPRLRGGRVEDYPNAPGRSAR
jgi:uncharacterized membrane protein